MSGRFIRASSYRHVYGEQVKAVNAYTDFRIGGEALAANGKFFTVAATGGGGPVFINPVGSVGRVGVKAKKIGVHRGKVLQAQFCPTNDNVLALGSEDCSVSITSIPDDLKSNISKADVVLKGHRKKIADISWHPTSSGVIASGSFDGMVKVWDVEAQADKVEFEASTVSHVEFNYDGSLLAITSKDKTAHLLDPRQASAAQSFEPHTGTKGAQMLFTRDEKLLSVGYSRSSMREMKIYDPKKLDEPVSTTTMGQGAGMVFAHYDRDTGLVFLAGKGNSSISYYEIKDDQAYKLSEFRDVKPQKEVCFFPKRACDASKCEIARCLRIIDNRSLFPVSFIVPRKSDMFQEDIFPDTYAGISVLSADDYFAGKNVAPPTTSMRPGEKTEQVVKKLAVKKSPAELQKELDAALARIAELELEVKKLKGSA